MKPWVAMVVVLVSLAAARARADFGEADSPWSLTAQLGGAFLAGNVEHHADGQLVRTDGENIEPFLDVRGSVARTFGRWFALSGQLGLTNWSSLYLDDAGYSRSTYLSLAISPELRLPLGRCTRCPVAYVGARGGYAPSWIGLGAPHATVEETGKNGHGGLVGARIGLILRFSRERAWGMKLETGVEKTWLHHEVELSGIGKQDLDFELERFVSLVGFWWNQ